MSAADKTTIDTVRAILCTMERMTNCHDPSRSAASNGTSLPTRPGSHPELSTYLAREYPSGLFRHQAAALDLLMEGRNTVVVTRTSSGKSLIYSVPVLNGLLAEPDSASLFLFPKKALANDQLQRLITTVEQIPTLSRQRAANPQLISRYDGATPEDDRPSIRDRGQVILTNPDMLHYSILAYPKNWARLLSRLRHVIVDECHEYRGVFGTNVSYLFRRLRALCRRHGSDPTFIATSATVQSPQDHIGG